MALAARHQMVVDGDASASAVLISGVISMSSRDGLASPVCWVPVIAMLAGSHDRESPRLTIVKARCARLTCLSA
jgi:hypothetical protein